jgi:hypothetical protein
MFKRVFQVLVRITLLAAIIVLAITAIFPGWYDNRHIVVDEITAKFMSTDDLIIRENAQRQNRPYKEVKAEVLQKRKVKEDRQALAANLKEAIQTQDQQRLLVLLSSSLKRDFPQDLYVQAIEQNYLDGLEIINRAGIACNALPTQFKDDAIMFNAINSIHAKTLNAVFKSNATVFSKWLELDCYKVHSNIEQRLIGHPQFSEWLNSVSFDDKDAAFWQKILSQSVATNNDEIAKKLIAAGVALSNDSLLTINNRRLSASNNVDPLTSLIQRNKIELAAEILQKQPNYIAENNLDQEVFNAIKSGRQLRSIYEAFPSSFLRLDALQFKPAEELEQAVQKGNLARIIWLLELDPSINFSMLEPASSEQALDYAKLDRSLQFDNVEHIRLLLERGFDLNSFEYKGLDQVANAARRGDVDLVSLLLEKGVKLNTLYRGQSILTALSSGNLENHKAIKALLISKGAHDNLGKLVRQTTGVKYNPQCKIGLPSIQQFATKPEYLGLINDAIGEGLKANNFGICHASLLLCTKDQKNSLDDCFESAPACTGDDNQIVFGKDKQAQSLCCPAAAKFRYNEMRCSGLGVISASAMLRDMGFPETYTMPTFMLNTPEYQKLRQPIK